MFQIFHKSESFFQIERMYPEHQRKEMISRLSTAQKKQLLEQAAHQPKNESPVTLLTSIRTEQNPDTIQRLRVSLASATENYLQQFFSANGLQTLLEVANSFIRKSMSVFRCYTITLLFFFAIFYPFLLSF